MDKFRIWIRRFEDLSFTRLFNTIKGVQNQKKVPGLLILIDMVLCYLILGTGYLDYYNFGFVNTPWKKRRTFMTMAENVELCRKLDDSEKRMLFEDKISFLKTFSKYIGREWLDLRESGEEGFAAFVKKHPVFFAKVVDGSGGKGVKKIKTDVSTDIPALYAELCGKKMWLTEEPIRQHYEMNRLCPDSINTIRMTTILKDGVPHLMYSLVRIGAGGTEVDNVSSGGYHAILDDDGIIRGKAHHEKSFSLAEKHPMTGTIFNGFAVPRFSDAKKMVLEAAEVVPEVRYVGWDVAISEDGPVFVEGNTLPGYDMCQNYCKVGSDRTGIKPLFKEVLGEEFPD